MNNNVMVRSDDLRNGNRRRVLACLRKTGRSHATELAKNTGLSAASISSLTAQLVEQNIVASSRSKHKSLVNARGRPQSLVELNANAGDIVTVSLSIDFLKVQRLDYTGAKVYEHHVTLDTRSLSEIELIDAICNAIDTCLCQQNLKRDVTARHIGMAYSGTTDHANGTLLWSPIVAHQNIQLGTELKRRFNIPVSITNDCCLIAEALNNTHQSTLGGTFATLVFSHGIGLGMFVDGKPFLGKNSSAMELGHLTFERNGALCRCGRNGCIEAYAADYGIERLVAGDSIDTPPSGRVEPSVFQNLRNAAKDKDIPAMQAFAIAGAAIGEGLSTLFTLFGPMPVALVGRDGDCLKLMEAGINSAFRDHSLDQNIDELLHRFDATEPLLEAGLAMNTLSRLDHNHAYSTQAPATTSA